MIKAFIFSIHCVAGLPDGSVIVALRWMFGQVDEACNHVLLSVNKELNVDDNTNQ